jgi:hypothetical protein
MARISPDPAPAQDARAVLAKAFLLAERDPVPDLPARGTPIEQPVMQVLGKYLADSTAMLEAIPENLDGIRFSVGWDSGCTNPPVSLPFLRIRALMTALALKAIYEAERGNASAAAEAIRKGFEVAVTINDDTEGTATMRCGGANAVCGMFEQVLSRTALDAAALLELERRIRPELFGNFEHALVGERCVGIFWLEEYRRKRRHEPNRAVKDIFEKLCQFFGRARKPAYRGEDYVRFLDTMDAQAALQSRPPLERLRINVGIEANYWTNVSGLASGYTPGVLGWSSLRSGFETRARLIALKTALAVERYRLSSGGKIPQSLAEVPSNYLPAIPTDPFDGQPLRYKTLERGYVIWSVGADGEDHQGAERGGPMATNPYDVTIVVER